MCVQATSGTSGRFRAFWSLHLVVPQYLHDAASIALLPACLHVHASAVASIFRHRSQDSLQACRIKRGERPSTRVQQHLDEAMAPDGIDLEYVYVPMLSDCRPGSQKYARISRECLDRYRGRAYAPGQLRPGQGKARPGSAYAHLQPSRAGSKLQGAWQHSIAHRGQQAWTERPHSARTSQHAAGRMHDVMYPWDDSLAGAPPRLAAHASNEHGHARRSTGPARPASASAAQAPAAQYPVPRAAADTGIMAGALDTATYQILDSVTHDELMALAAQGLVATRSNAVTSAPADGATAQHEGALPEGKQQQLRELLSRANQCAAALGSHHRFVEIGRGDQGKRKNSAVVERRTFAVWPITVNNAWAYCLRVLALAASCTLDAACIAAVEPVP
jgi:hypothetical protein